jgi:GNAT superfamily N-acetyltransferase
VNIRQAVSEDAGDVYDVHASVGGSIPWSGVDECRRHIEWMMDLGVPPLVAEVDGRAVAEMEVWWGEDVPELGRSLDVSMVDVRPDYQGLGIGRALIRHAVLLAGEKGCRRASVWTAPEAVGFYRKVGFEDYLSLRRHTLAPTDLVPAGGIEFRPVRLADLADPNGVHMKIGRILHPRQRWHDMLHDEARPPRWEGTGERRESILACVADVPGGAAPAIAVYRLCHWLGDASRAELYLWSPNDDSSVLSAAVGRAADAAIRELSMIAYGRVAAHLAALGATVEAEELKVLALDLTVHRQAD